MGALRALFGDIYNGKNVFITGHTGFKGSWLALWLSMLGANVYGYSLNPPTTPNHFDTLGLKLANDTRADIRDAKALRQAVLEAVPDVIFHLAAQPLVGHSYQDPEGTYATNVMGTLNLLQAALEAKVKATLVVTSDKAYENLGTPKAYSESDRLGGYDPYSSSKACAELLVSSFRQSFFEPCGLMLATARAGNVIGGGDWAKDRLMTDIITHAQSAKPLKIRNQNATRPWQYVLDALAGYLMLAKELLLGHGGFARAFNFAPNTTPMSVGEILKIAQDFYPDLKFNVVDKVEFKEAMHLGLDSSLAKKELGWQAVLSAKEAIKTSFKWYDGFHKEVSGGLGCYSKAYLDDYVALAKIRGAKWLR